MLLLKCMDGLHGNGNACACFVMGNGNELRVVGHSDFRSKSVTGWRFASAGQTLPRGKFARDLAALRALVGERSVKGVVVADVASGSKAARARVAFNFIAFAPW